jgi:hypothetical protein
MTTRVGRISTSVVTAWLADLATQAPYLALMTSDPYAAQDPLTTEVVSGTYARSNTAWSVTGRLMTATNNLLWNGIPAGTHLFAIAGFSAVTNGVLKFSSPIPGGLYYAVAGGLSMPSGSFAVGIDTVTG